MVSRNVANSETEVDKCNAFFCRRAEGWQTQKHKLFA